MILCILKRKKYTLLIFENITQPNKEKEGWDYLSVTKLLALLHKGDFYCLNCLHSFLIKNKFNSLEKLCKNKDFCGVTMSSEKDDILEFNQCMKSDKMTYIIYAHIECLIKKQMGVQIIQNIFHHQKFQIL